MTLHLKLIIISHVIFHSGPGGFFLASTSFLKASIFFEMLGTLKTSHNNE